MGNPAPGVGRAVDGTNVGCPGIGVGAAVVGSAVGANVGVKVVGALVGAPGSGVGAIVGAFDGKLTIVAFPVITIAPPQTVFAKQPSAKTYVWQPNLVVYEN